jgi:hypothetical protein
MFVLVMERRGDYSTDSKANIALIGPFKTADLALKHLHALPRPDPGMGWSLAPINKPIKIKPPKKPKAKKKAKRHARTKR